MGASNGQRKISGNLAIGGTGDTQCTSIGNQNYIKKVCKILALQVLSRVIMIELAVVCDGLRHQYNGVGYHIAV
jgi:hypothetical protein